ncbi:MAG: pyridoxal phosphate-dependent aminotransferase [Acidobacteriota bacterium]
METPVPTPSASAPTAPNHDVQGAEPASASAFRRVPRTGVIYVTTEAEARGFSPEDPAWTNFGQGMPETGPLPEAQPRVEAVPVLSPDHEYAPVAGVWELRDAIAQLYNHLYRRGLPTQYSAENVAISSGGRAALTRAAAALGSINLGHFLPDYTAYEELLDIFRLFAPIPVLLDPRRGYNFTAEDLRQEVLGRGLSAVLLSNPCNPTGRLLSGGELQRWVATARELDCSLLLDEFYSHFVWQRDPEEPGPTVSAARWVEDVERDPVVLFDGLTKNWRYPGWRVCWTVGPKHVIRALSSAGSFLDGGGSRPLQRAAVPLLDPVTVEGEARALQQTFGAKRTVMLERLRGMGLRVDPAPQGTFYVWANVEDLPAPLSDGLSFFRAALERQVICVPGIFFDVNPGQRRARHRSRFHAYLRLSFGPPMERLVAGLDRLEGLIADARAGRLDG